MDSVQYAHHESRFDIHLNQSVNSGTTLLIYPSGGFKLSVVSPEFKKGVMLTFLKCMGTARRAHANSNGRNDDQGLLLFKRPYQSRIHQISEGNDVKFHPLSG